MPEKPHKVRTCSSCGKVQEMSQLFSVSTSQALQFDPVFGDGVGLRFRASQFKWNGSNKLVPIDPLGELCPDFACGECRQLIPKKHLAARHQPISPVDLSKLADLFFRIQTSIDEKNDVDLRAFLQEYALHALPLYTLWQTLAGWARRRLHCEVESVSTTEGLRDAVKSIVVHKETIMPEIRRLMLDDIQIIFEKIQFDEIDKSLQAWGFAHVKEYTAKFRECAFDNYDCLELRGHVSQCVVSLDNKYWDENLGQVEKLVEHTLLIKLSCPDTNPNRQLVFAKVLQCPFWSIERLPKTVETARQVEWKLRIKSLNGAVLNARMGSIHHENIQKLATAVVDWYQNFDLISEAPAEWRDEVHREAFASLQYAASLEKILQSEIIASELCLSIENSSRWQQKKELFQRAQVLKEAASEGSTTQLTPKMIEMLHRLETPWLVKQKWRWLLSIFNFVPLRRLQIQRRDQIDSKEQGNNEY